MKNEKKIQVEKEDIKRRRIKNSFKKYKKHNFGIISRKNARGGYFDILLEQRFNLTVKSYFLKKKLKFCVIL